MTHKRYCIMSKCRSTENLHKNFYNKKTGIQYYLCTECSSERMRKYRKTPKGAEVTRRTIKASEARYPGKQEARVALNCALKKGIIKKPKKCQITDCPETTTQGHHPNYRNALFAVFLCVSHHREFHQPL